jgi:UPF0716 protein FxsA
MPLLLLVIFIAVPLIEIGLFIQVGEAIGLWSTLAVVVFTAILGTWMLKRQGFNTLQKFQNELGTDVLPAHTLFDGICLLAAGLLLLTPGFFTDVIGFLLFVPGFRAVIRGFLSSRFKIQHGFSNMHEQKKRQQPGRPTNGAVIDGEFVDLDDTNEGTRRD